MRNYRCLTDQEFAKGEFKLVPIRDEDKYSIMQWRNEQISILRQKSPLTKENQEKYFKEVVEKLFEEEQPSQLLFSFLENGNLIGYGGLVHIDWENKNAEISFLTETSRIQNRLVSDWIAYLALLKQLASIAGFIKIYTYAYDVRPMLYEALRESSFKEEARLKKHVFIEGGFADVLIHSFFLLSISLRRATASDLMTYFQWTNDAVVRSNSFNSKPIALSAHENWFLNKISSGDSFLFVALLGKQPVGQIRFDSIPNMSFEIGFSIDENFRGLGLGSEIIRVGTNELIRLNPSVIQVIGKVKKENVGSMQSFVKAGYSLTQDSVDGLLYLLFSK